MGKLFSEFKCLLLLDAARHVCYKVLHVKCSMMATACCNCCLSCMLQIRTGCVEQQRSPGHVLWAQVLLHCPMQPNFGSYLTYTVHTKAQSD